MKERYKDTTPMDRGYSWVVLAACFLMYTLVIGTIKTFGILYIELLDYYDAGAGRTASIISTCSFVQAILGPIANSLSINFNFSRVTFVGSIFMFIGFFTSAFVYRLEHLFLTYSVIFGIGYGLTSVPCRTILNFYFEKHRALANGIVFSGSGIGGFALPFLYRFLIDQYGLHGALIVLGGVMLNCCVASLLFQQPSELREDTLSCTGNKLVAEEKLIEANKTNNCNSYFRTLKTLFNFRWSLFRSPAFVLVTLAYTLACAGYDSNFYIIPAMVEQRGYGKTEVAMSMSVIGISQVVSRILIGWFMDQKILSAYCMFVICMFISGLSVFSVPYLHNLELLYGYSVIVGIFPGFLYTFLPLIIISTVGLGNLPPALGLLTVIIAIGNVVAQPCLGWLEDVTGSWDASNFCVGVLLLSSSVIMLIVDFCLKKTGDQNEPIKDVESDTDTPTMTENNNVPVVKEEKLVVDRKV